MAKHLTEDQKAEIQDLRAKGLTYRAIAKEIGCSFGTVHFEIIPEDRERSRAKHRSWREVHRDESRASCRRYYYQHPEKKAHHRGYMALHKERARITRHDWYVTHREEEKACASQYQKTHPEITKRNKAKYRREHPEKTALWLANRRALIAGVAIGLTAGQKNEIDEIYRRAKEDRRVRCYLCGDLIKKGHRHVDHIVPISKGGAHRPSNLAVACDECNLSKHNKLPEEIGVLL